MAAAQKWSPRLWTEFYGRNDRKVERMQNAVWAFHQLGVERYAAIPDLVRLMKEGRTNSAHVAAYVIGDMDEGVTPVLLDVLTNRAAYPRLTAGALRTMVARPLTNGPRFVAVIVSYLTNHDAGLRGSAALMLGDLRAAPDTAVPGLIGSVGDQDKNVRCLAIAALGDFRANAREAVPSLLPVLHDPDRSVRDAVTNALEQIAPEVLKTNWVTERQ